MTAVVQPYNRFVEFPVTLREDSAAYQSDCAEQVVCILLKTTGLSTILRRVPAVVVGAGNWISFTAHRPVSSEAIFGLVARNGKLVFVPDLLDRRRKARSRTSPSLHLMNLDSAENLRGHVDAHYWARYPLAHAGEYFTKTTTLPSDLLKRLQR